MKKTIIVILTVLFIFLPIGSSDNRVLFGLFIALWPIASITLVVLYLKWFNPYKDISSISDILQEGENQKNKEINDSNKENDGNVD